MEITVIVSGISGAGILALVADRLWEIRKNRKNGDPNNKILSALKKLGEKSDRIQEEVGKTQSDMGVVKNEVENINKRCTTHLQNQAEVNKAHSFAISKNTDKLFDLAKKKE
jgi:hypothetical protein